MGEYADQQIAREIRETGQRMAREHSRELHDRTMAARRAAGREEAARNQAVHDAREAEVAAVFEAGKIPTMLEVGLELRRIGRAVHAFRTGTPSRIGIWTPGKRHQVGGHRVDAATPEAWVELLVQFQTRAALAVLKSDREAVRRAR